MLIVTFTIALAERQRNRDADRFGETVLKFAADLSDKLYADIQQNLEEFRGSPNTLFGLAEFDEKRQKLLTDFTRELFHTRTLIMLRVRLFPHCDTAKLTSIFEEVEDNFVVAVGRLEPTEKHPELLTVHVAEASSKLLNYLLEREAILEKGTLARRMIRIYKRIDAHLREFA